MPARVLNEDEFTSALDAAGSDAQAMWGKLVDVARGEANVASADKKLLVQIRNNASYHYYQPKEMGRGLLQCFFADDKIPANERAHYSPGENMERSRFYYTDAAALRAIQLTGERVGLEDPSERIKRLAERVNRALQPLICAFLSGRAAKANDYETEK